MKKRVLHILNEATYGGAEVTAVRIAQNLTSFESHLLFCYTGEALNELNNIGVATTTLINRAYSNKSFILIKYLKFVKFLFNNHFDIIHYHTGGIGILLLSFFCAPKSRIIFHVHSGIITGKNQKKRIPYLHKFILRLLKDKTFQIFCAKHVADYFANNIGKPGKSLIIENASPYQFQEKQKSNNGIGYLGRITGEKGSTLLFNFLQKTKDYKLNVNFFLKGPVSLTKNKKIEEYLDNCITYEKPSFDIEPFLKNVDLILFLSPAPEASPLVIFEALSFDVGIIALRSKAVIEILGNNYPLLITEVTNDNILEKINLYYSTEIRIKELTKIHKNISDQNSFQKMKKQIEEFYSKIV